MDLKILRDAAVLAAPAIALQNVTAELAVRLRFKPQSRPFPLEPVRDRSHDFEQLQLLRCNELVDQPSEG